MIEMSTRAKARRNAEIRRRRAGRLSLGALAREFRVTRTRIVQILEATGGDPIREDLARYGPDELERMRDRLTDRIGSDLRQLMNVEDELESRRVDRINGLA